MGFADLFYDLNIKYDSEKGERVILSRSGKTIRIRTPQGERYYQSYKSDRKNNPDLKFEEWLKDKISSELNDELEKVYGLFKKRPTLEDAVRSYIKFHPKTRRGSTSMGGFFQYYDLETGESAVLMNKGEFKKIRERDGNQFYSDYGLEFRRGNTDMSFEEWVGAKIPNKLYEELMRTVYYVGKRSKS